MKPIRNVLTLADSKSNKAFVLRLALWGPDLVISARQNKVIFAIYAGRFDPEFVPFRVQITMPVSVDFRPNYLTFHQAAKRAVRAEYPTIPG